MNQIGTVTVTTARPLIFDRYADNRGTGSFILIDPATNFTAGAGMITQSGPRSAAAASARRPAPPNGWRAWRADGGVRRRSDRSGAPRARGDLLSQ